MIDLHTHTLFSDGELLPSELVRRAEVLGYEAIALTDHADWSNIDFIVPRLVRVCKDLNRSWKIRSLPGVEITHAPLGDIKKLVNYARKHGAQIVVIHGETVSEPVIPGTNRAGIEAGCDIIAHPGYIEENDVRLAKEHGVCLELTTRKSHYSTNKHVFNLAKRIGAKLVLNTDSHCPCDLITDAQRAGFLKKVGLDKAFMEALYRNSSLLARQGTKNVKNKKCK